MSELLANKRTIYARFLERADELADQPAILANGTHETTFGELRDCVAGARLGLHSHGIGRGSRIGFLILDRASAGVAHLVACATGTSVPLNAAMAPTELMSAVKDFRIDAILVADGLPDSLLEAARESGANLIPVHPSGKTGLFAVSPGSAETPVDTACPESDDIAVLLQTSGTTSTPKIVPQTNSNRYASMTRKRQDRAVGPGDRCLNLMPLHHTQGVNAEFLSPLLNGASVVFATFDPANLINLVERYRPTYFNLVPSMHQAVLESLDGAEEVFKDRGILYTRTSSAKLTLSLRKRLERAYGVPVIESYGASETSNIASSGLSKEDYREGSVGRPVSGSSVIVTDPAGNTLPTGERGEICVSGPTVITGYVDNPEANAERFRDGWYLTGDEGYFDGDGFLFVTGRLQEVVNRGGEKFSLTEIDEVLLRIEGVDRGAAFAAEHERLGHEIYAAVVLAPGSGATPATVRTELANHLSWARVPKQIFIVSELPINSTGKILRDELTESLIEGSR